MAWAKIDDQFLDNPKIRRAGKDAAFLYVAGLLHCNKYLTDGFIEECFLPKIATAAFLRNHFASARVLVTNDLWMKVEGGYRVNDYLKYNLSKEQIKKLRENGKKGGEAKALAIATAKAIPNAKAIALANALAIYPLSHKEEDKDQSSSLSDEIFEVVEIYSRLFGKFDVEAADFVERLCERYSEYPVLLAFRRAEDAQAKNRKYVSAVLSNWEKKNELPEKAQPVLMYDAWGNPCGTR